jgi:hypothetical protein
MGKYSSIFHLGFAFLIFPLYHTLGEGLKYAMAPYILYLMFSKNFLFFPALFVHSASGSTITLLILVASFIIPLIHLKTLRRLKLASWFVWAMLPLPVLFFQALSRLFFYSKNLQDSLLPIGMYMWIFPFFYAIIVAERGRPYPWKTTFLCLALMWTFSFFHILPEIRAATLSFILLFTIAGSFIINFGKLGAYVKEFGWLLSLLAITSVAVVGLGIQELKFSVLFSIIVAIAILGLYKLRWKNLIRVFSSTPFYILLAGFVIYAIANASRLAEGLGTEGLAYNNLDDFWAHLEYKTFGDRGILWEGAWNQIASSKHYLPPIFLESYEFYNVEGSLMKDIEFGAHNVILELFRNLGILFGIFASVYYIWFLIHVGRVLKNRRLPPYILSLTAALFGIGLVFGLTGQLTVQITTSFVYACLLGVVCSQDPKLGGNKFASTKIQAIIQPSSENIENTLVL